MEEPNINNLEQFIELQTGLVPTNLNPEAWVSRQKDTVGGLQPFNNLNELCNFHPNKLQLNMEANVGPDDKYRLITMPTLSDYPLSQVDTDPNYFLNFWELKVVEFDIAKRDNLLAGTGIQGSNSFFKIADVASGVAGTKVELKLSIQTNYNNSGILDLIITLNADGSLFSNVSKLSYTEYIVGASANLNFYVRGSNNKLELWANISSNLVNDALYYSILQDTADNTPWVFYENSNSSVTILPSNSTVIPKYKYNTNTVDDVRVSNNELQQRKYTQDGNLGSYVNKSPLITSASVVSSATRYINSTINGQSNLIDLFPIIDSRLNSTPNLQPSNPANNTNTNTTLNNTRLINKSFLISNNLSRDRVFICNFECQLQRDGGSNEEFNLTCRRGNTQGSASTTTGTIVYNNKFIINADSLHQRSGLFFDIIPANSSRFYYLFADISQTTGGNANFFGPLKESHILI